MNNFPKVSVIMGIYNCEDTLDSAIQSIINQTYSNWELIMCDDCSSDNTYKIAKKYELRYPDKIKVIKNTNNLTLAPTLNRCLKLATGKYIARQDADDYSHINRLEKQVEFLENNLNIDLVGTSVIYFDQYGQRSKKKLEKEPNLEKLFKFGSQFIHPSIVIKKEVIEKLNGYSEENIAIQQEDYELWGKFFYNGYKATNLENYLYYYKEDEEAYKRRTKRRRLRAIRLSIKMRKEFKMPIKSYIFLTKDIVFLFIPRFILNKYYERRI